MVRLKSFQSFLFNEDVWDLLNISMTYKVVASTYYQLTTLSTVGFGDLYPMQDHERVVIAFNFLFGVAIFSYFMGELSTQMQALILTDG